MLCCLQPYYRQQMEGAAAFVRLEKERDQLRTSLEQATKRVAELEQKLQDQSEMEKTLRESQEREQTWISSSSLFFAVCPGLRWMANSSLQRCQIIIVFNYVNLNLNVVLSWGVGAQLMQVLVMGLVALLVTAFVSFSLSPPKIFALFKMHLRAVHRHNAHYAVGLHGNKQTSPWRSRGRGLRV